jgi:hypothetical protein
MESCFLNHSTQYDLPAELWPGDGLIPPLGTVEVVQSGTGLTGLAGYWKPARSMLQW